MSPTPEFRYTLDAAYMDAAHAHTIAQSPAWRRMVARAILPVVFFGLCALFVWRFHDRPLELGLALVVVIGIFGYEFLKERRKRRERFRGTALENAPVRVVLGELGVEIEVADSSIRLAWAAHIGARAFEDGWMLVQGPGEARWLPKAGLQGATPEQVDECLRTRISDFARVA